MIEKKRRAETLLRQALDNPTASFRQGQWESIEQVLLSRRVLVVQRTGWGKSMVYFLSAKLLRESGAGITLLISPLLSLMRNQLEAAQRIGVRARTLNSTNPEDWEDIQEDLLENAVDILLISPERLANADFLHNILGEIAHNIAFFVVDEAHCISDWGHDFRPDYRRIIRVLQALPSNIPVLTTTATANDRVVRDIQAQLAQGTQDTQGGDGLCVQRGSLVRKSLKLQNVIMPNPAARLAWMAEHIPTLSGSGIVYTLTQRDADKVAAWLRLCNINAKAYHASMDAQHREELEQELLHNNIKALVATVALGMGFDKPDLGFVIHYQRPASVVHYYQQVGRAGRAVDEAYGVLLSGAEDDRIADYFIREAFPPQQHINSILQILLDSEKGLSLPELQRALNLQYGQIVKTIQFLTVESPSPVTKIGTKWTATASATDYKVDEQHIENITNIRYAEQAQMKEYMRHTGCLMAFLQKALDDAHPSACGQCHSCTQGALLPTTIDDTLAKRASLFLRTSYLPLSPRKRWPLANMFTHYPFKPITIPNNLRIEEGRALCQWQDVGWGRMVAAGKCEQRHFSDELVDACVHMLSEWKPQPAPAWVTCVPTREHPHLLPDFAARLAAALGVPFIPCVHKVRDNQEQKFMENSFQQVKNLDGIFAIDTETVAIPEAPCLLVDDIVMSKWTLTVVAALLRNAGCSAVHPLALALNPFKTD